MIVGDGSAGLGIGLSSGLSYWLLLGLSKGLSGDTLNENQRILPNQGIRRSARRSLLIGFISGCICWLVFMLNVGLSHALDLGLSLELHYGLDINGLSYALGYGVGFAQGYGLGPGLELGLLIGVTSGLLAALLNGGLACVRHYALRWLLWRHSFLPWNYPRFLDFATEPILLRKVGGGYIFVHRLLLDYFASLKTPSSEEASQCQRGSRRQTKKDSYSDLTLFLLRLIP